MLEQQQSHKALRDTHSKILYNHLFKITELFIVKATIRYWDYDYPERWYKKAKHLTNRQTNLLFTDRDFRGQV